jgi:prepilin signal peptidase PulO-like enzyme (type II secretory pathway)
MHPHHHLIAYILQLLGGGLLGLASASVASQLGMRSGDRLPGESRLPHCVYCMKALTWQEAFPLFGWLLRPDTLTFPCPCARRKGLLTQPFVEGLGFLLGMGAVFCGGWADGAIALALGIGILPAIALVDLHFGIIPDGLNICVALFGFFWALQASDIYVALIVAAVLLSLGLFCALVYSRWRGREMLGLGDVKFFAAAGFWLTPEMVPWFLALGGVLGALLGFIWKKKGGGQEFPFGPALCLSLAICILYELAVK